MTIVTMKNIHLVTMVQRTYEEWKIVLFFKTKQKFFTGTHIEGLHVSLTESLT